MAVTIHHTAIVDPNAVLDDDVVIGPYCVIGKGAFIGARTHLFNHVTVMGNVRIGCDNIIYPYCLLGGEPQDKSYRGSPTWLIIGDRNIIRETCTMHRATEKELGITRLGSDNYIMGGCHFAHDVQVGSHCQFGNNCLLSGHVHVQDHASLSGMIGVHHFTRVGSYCFVGGCSRVVVDVPPFMLAEGNDLEIRCVNLVGLRRRGFSVAEIHSLQEAHRLLYRQKTGAAHARETLEANNHWTPPVQELFTFLEEQHQGRNGRGREGRKAA